MNQEEIRVNRLEKLKQETILHYLKDIHFEDPKDLYQVMMKHVFMGDLDYHFLSRYLEGVEEEEKQRIFALGRKYQSLCFYQGDFHYWMDSIEGVYLNDLDLVSMKVLDHYDFLLGLIKDGGEEVLKQLKAFQKTPMEKNGSIIDFLRNTFIEDDILKKILIEMSKENSSYNIFTEKEKQILCHYPEGNLYRKEKEEIKIMSPSEILNHLEKYKRKEKDLSFEESVITSYYDYENQ